MRSEILGVQNMKFMNKILISASLLFLIATTDVFASKIAITLKVFPPEYDLKIDGKNGNCRPAGNFLKKVYIDTGKHSLVFSSKGYDDKNLNIDISRKTGLLEVKLEKKFDDLKKVAVLKTGLHPKSVEFTPDGKYFASALLEDKGIDLFSTETFKKIKRLTVPDKYSKREGFVEIEYLPEKNEMWVSQMSTSMIHVFSMDKFEYKLSFSTKGVWTKIMAFTPDKKLGFASNWESKDVSIIDVDKHTVIKKVRVSGIPRGMVVTNDGKTLYVCIFGNGQIQKIDIPKMKLSKTISFPKGAKRHVVLDRKKNILYITDMYRGSVYVMNADNDKVIKEIKVDQKLNTGKLTPDGKYLMVSSRGPNNRETYLKKGPKFGKVYIIDTQTLKIRSWIWGKNQPTGLDISPEGKYLAFTNFLDNEIEVYRINLD